MVGIFVFMSSVADPNSITLDMVTRNGIPFFHYTPTPKIIEGLLLSIWGGICVILVSFSTIASVLLLGVFPSRFGTLGPHMLRPCLIDSLVIGELFSIF